MPLFLTPHVPLGNPFTEPTPPADPTDFAYGGDAYGLLGVSDWHTTNSAASTASELKDGTLFTADMAAKYNGILWWVANETAITNLCDNDDVYAYSRDVGLHINGILDVFRFTGDLRLLDAVHDWLDIMKGKLAVPWRPGYDTGLWGSKWSPYLKWVWNAGGNWNGVDIDDPNTRDQSKLVAWVALAARAFDVNRGLSSPAHGAGAYATAADYWKGWLTNHHRPAWQGGPATDWRANYLGLRYPDRRATDDDWPFVMNAGDSHSVVSVIIGQHYWHELTGWDGPRLGRDRLMTRQRSQELVAVEGAGGATANVVWSHGFRSEGSPSNTLQPITYVRYQLTDMFTLWLCGFDPFWTVEAARQPWRSFDEFVLQSDGSLLGDIAGGVPMGGLAVSSDYATKTALQATSYGYGWGLAFAPANTVTIMTTNQTAHGNGFTNPTYVSIPAGLFMRGALTQLGAL